MRLHLLLLAAFLCALLLRTDLAWAEGLVINEFVARNTDGLRDEDGDYSDCSSSTTRDPPTSTCPAGT